MPLDLQEGFHALGALFDGPVKALIKALKRSSAGGRKITTEEWGEVSEAFLTWLSNTAKEMVD